MQTIEEETAVTIAERIERSETRVCITVFPFITNHHDTLFGGKALAIMDEVSFMAATRFCRKRLVTVSTDKIDFNKAIPAGSIVEAVGRVEKVGNTSVKVRVQIFLESMYEDSRELAIQGSFTFVALDDDKKPIPVLQGLDVSS
mgnify:CR=1 FL=1